MTPEEQRVRAAAGKHALQSAFLLGRAIGMKGMRYATMLRWGKPTQISEDRGHVVMHFANGSKIIGNSVTGQLVIYPAD